MTKISVEYELLAGIEVDTETGEVERVVVWPCEFNSVLPIRYFTSCEDGLPEYLPTNHELAKKALAIADTVHVTEDELKPRWEKA